MSMVGFPLLLIPLAIYNIIVFLMPSVSLTEPLVTLPLMSGAQWPLTLSDVLLSLGIAMLLLEVIKGARPGAKYFTDHLLSLIVFGGAVAEFLMWPRFANSTYFLLTLLALTDFLSGVSLRVRRSVLSTATASRGSSRVSTEIRREPGTPHEGGWPSADKSASHAPSSAAPSEPTFDHPKAVHPETAATTHPSEGSSVGSQPDNGSPPPESAH
jgi:hypothetical protein